MDMPQTDLLRDFALVTRTIEQLGQRLTNVAEQVRTAGMLPSESLIEEISTSRRSFIELRDKAIELVGLLAGSPPKAPDEIESMKELEDLLKLATDAQQKKAQEEKFRLRSLTILDRILSLVHRDHAVFSPLLEAQARAKALREVIRAHDGPEAHPDATALAQGRHPLAELLTLVDGYEDLDDDLWLLLKYAVAEHFGQSLAMNAARGKLRPSPTRLTADRSLDDQPATQQAPPA